MLIGALAGVPVVLDREEGCRHLVRRAADRHSGRRPEELPEGAYFSQIPLQPRLGGFGALEEATAEIKPPPTLFLSAGGGDPTRIFQTELRVSS